MKTINIKAERNYQVQVGVDGLAAIKQICQDHNRVLLIAPNSLIKLFKLKQSKNLNFLPAQRVKTKKVLQH